MRDNVASHGSFAARSSRAALCLTALVLGMVGCNQAQTSELTLVPAFGKVTLDGQPLADAMLEFVPAGQTASQGATAKTDADGGYSVIYATGAPGLPAGEYQVVVTKRILAKGAVDPGKDVPPIYRPEVESLPKTYSDKRETTLKATIPASGEANTIFQLKSSKTR